MIVNTLKSNQPSVIVITILFGVLFWLYSIIEPIGMAIPSDAINMPLYQLMANALSYNSVVAISISLVLVILQAFLLVQFNKRHIVINHRTYLPAFFYILFVSSFVQLQRFNPVIIGSIFIFAAVNFIYSTYRTEYALNKIYLAGFFISLASLIWAPFAILFLIIWISLLILRPFIGREWVVSILGFLTPYLFVFTYCFVFLEEGMVNHLIGNYMANFDLIKHFYALHISYYLFYGVMLIIIILASFAVVQNFQKKKIRNRKFFTINWWLFILSIVMFSIFKNVTYEIIFLTGIPLSYLLTDYFYTTRKSLYLNISLAALIGLMVYIQIAAH